MGQFATALENIFLHRDKPPFLRLLIYAAYLVPPAAVVALTWHDQNIAGLQLHSTEITRPHDAYVKHGAESGLWAPKDGYENAFFSAFSPHYFKGTGPWVASFEAGVARATVTVVFKNEATSTPFLVNSLSVVARLEQRLPFYWRRLNVDTKLKIDSWLEDDGSKRRVRFLNSGVGPILDLEAELTAGDDLKLRQHYTTPHLRGSEFVEFQFQVGGDRYLPIDHQEEVLKWPMSRRVQNGESLPADAQVIDCRLPKPTNHDISSYRDSVCSPGDPGRYEVIDKLRRLREVTDVRGPLQSVTVSYSYKDVKGKPYRDKLDIKIIEPQKEVADLPEAKKVIELAKKIFKVSAKGPTGVGLIKAEHTIDAKEMTGCAFGHSIVEPHELLASAGFISMTLNLYHAKNARYHLRFLVNGEERHDLRIETLVPDDNWFDGPSDAFRFQEQPQTISSPECPPTRAVTTNED